ncbi:MAG: TolC family protein [Planctomycetes bacterium]|nr:TolC family protein [Planctomycetota bacterium]
MSVLAGCSTAARRADLAPLATTLADLQARHAAAVPGPATDPDLDRLLAGPLDPELVARLAVERHPRLREAVARAEAASASIDVAGSYDPPLLKFEAEEIPRGRPFSLGTNRGNMLGLQQSVPFPGIRGLRAEAASRDAESMVEMYAMEVRDTAARARRALSMYYMATRELEIVRQHIDLLSEFERIADSRFRTGAAPQQDVLKPQVELVELQNQILALDQRIGSARAEINALLNRPAGAPLGPPAEVTVPPGEFDGAALAREAMEVRPEIRAAGLRLEASRVMLRLAEKETRSPMFMFEAKYVQMPYEEDAWSGMIGITLPWLTDRFTSEVRRMKQVVRADELAVEGLRTRVQAEVRDALLRVDAAARSLKIFDGELLPKTEQAVEVTRVNYENGRSMFLDLLDAERSLRDVRLRRYRVLADHATALADLERAVGRSLEGDSK